MFSIVAQTSRPATIIRVIHVVTREVTLLRDHVVISRFPILSRLSEVFLLTTLLLIQTMSIDEGQYLRHSQTM